MDTSIKYWQHQVAAINEAKQRDFFALFFEQGCGKSATVIRILEEKRAQQKQRTASLRTLILCPQIVVENWRRELLAHSEILDENIICLRGPGKVRASRLAILEGDTYAKANATLITNYEALNMPEVFKNLLRFHPQALVLDESHKCKDVCARRTKRAIELSELAQYRFILSGTPIVNSAFDIFSQFLIMDAGHAFGRNFRDFRSRYFYDENAGRPKQTYFPAWQLRQNSLSEINAVIASSSMRVKKSECLDLPPLVRQVVEVDLNPEQRRVYDDLEKDAVAVIGSGVCSADLAIKKLLRLQQVTSGFIKLDEGSNEEESSSGTLQVFTPNPKCLALAEIIGQIPAAEKIIIWCAFKNDYIAVRRTCEALGQASVEIHGGIKASDKSLHVDQFNSRTPGCGPRILIAHPASAGCGVNLTAASYSIFFSRGFSLENDLQAEARNYRGGSEIHTKITRIDIVARNTTDETVAAALAGKENVAETLLRRISSNN